MITPNKHVARYKPIKARKLQRLFSHFGDFNALDDACTIAHFVPNVDISHSFLRENLLLKYSDPSPDAASERLLAAMEKFRSSETRCRKFNDLVDSGKYLNKEGLPTILRYAERLIASVVDKNLPVDLFDGSYFTNGASDKRPRKVSQIYRKLDLGTDVSIYPHTYNGMRRYIDAFLPNLSDIKIVPSQGCVLSAVPKNNKEDRLIAKEAEFNQFFQRGVGVYLRRKLLRTGINLLDQKPNQVMAREGSSSGLYATIDLSAASDSVSTGLCKLLLPSWLYNIVMLLRAQNVIIPIPLSAKGERELTSLEKLSSMGNGYTFEIETLIFWGLCKACCILENRHHNHVETKVLVYGDDIVVPTYAVDLVKYALTETGFVLNEDKSFWTGPIRESCGKYYHLGRDITPFYLRNPYASIHDKYVTVNNFSRWSCREFGLYWPSWAISCWESLISGIPVRSISFGPNCEDDTYIFAPSDILERSKFAGNMRVCFDHDFHDQYVVVHTIGYVERSARANQSHSDFGVGSMRSFFNAAGDVLRDIDVYDLRHDVLSRSRSQRHGPTVERLKTRNRKVYIRPLLWD